MKDKLTITEVINYLVIHPDCQHKGLGSMILRLDAADRDNTETFLIAIAKGAPLYSKVGFEEVGRLEVDTAAYDGEEIVSCLSMIRSLVLGSLAQSHDGHPDFVCVCVPLG